MTGTVGLRLGFGAARLCRPRVGQYTALAGGIGGTLTGAVVIALFIDEVRALFTTMQIVMGAVAL